jgi:hypothetical protein
MIIVHVSLLAEGTNVWRPAQARHIQGSVYELLGNIPADEKWQFHPGQLVECVEQVFSGGGSGLVALRPISA